MALEPANHYEVSGKGITCVIDTAGLRGSKVVSLEVDGQTIENASYETSPFGQEVTTIVEIVNDGYEVHLRLVVPEVNVDGSPATFSGLALLGKARTSIGGPRRVNGSINLYELRPVAGTASAVRT